MAYTEDWSTATAIATEPLRRTSKPAATATGRHRWVAALLRVMGDWCERERQRRELSMMSKRDFGDLPVSPGAVRDEVGRWPWQKPNPQWSEVAGGRRCQSADRASR